MKRYIALALITAAFITAGVPYVHARQNGGMTPQVASMPYEEVSAAEAEALQFMIEEEKLACDVYTFLYETWNHRVFKNIARSEQTHMNAIQALLIKYGLDDPTLGSEAGVFQSPELAAMYDKLTSKGVVSLVDALHVGATIEDVDIKDLQEQIALSDNTDIRTVYQNLMKGSRNHLRAFVGQLEYNGGSYTAQFLTQEEVDAILAADHERGMVDADGNHIGGRGGK